MSSIRTTNFDALATATPLNREAATVRDGLGDQWEAKASQSANRWLAPPPLIDLSAPAHIGGLREAAGLVGNRFGRLVVVGSWASANRKKAATWVCRCDCGYYEGFKAKALRADRELPLACTACAATMRLQQRTAKPATAASRSTSAKMLDRLARDGSHA